MEKFIFTLLIILNKMKTEKYFLYVRKSSESDERQEQSIEDQIKVMTKVAERN
jgi:small neutral amino acid transporter SnatA (MarC family)